jgi:bisphosphoglycerate-independent phosphoglycerate mutase (AlkP superfamily)
LRNVFPFSKSPSFLSCMIEFRTSMGKIKLTNINGTRPSKRKEKRNDPHTKHTTIPIPVHSEKEKKCVKCALGGPLSKLCPSEPSCIQDGHHY